jgi:hypothetical protein
MVVPKVAEASETVEDEAERARRCLLAEGICVISTTTIYNDCIEPFCSHEAMR